MRRRWRYLPSRHAVDHVVDADHLDSDVPASRVDEMIAADGRCIAVTGKHDDFKVRVSELDAGREGDWPAVSHMERVHIEERTRDPAATPYTRDTDNLLFRDSQVVDGAEEGLRNHAVPAARAVRVWLRALPDVLGERMKLRHRHAQLTSFPI